MTDELPPKPDPQPGGEYLWAGDHWAFCPTGLLDCYKPGIDPDWLPLRPELARHLANSWKDNEELYRSLK